MIASIIFFYLCFFLIFSLEVFVDSSNLQISQDGSANNGFSTLDQAFNLFFNQADSNYVKILMKYANNDYISEKSSISISNSSINIFGFPYILFFTNIFYNKGNFRD